MAQITFFADDFHVLNLLSSGLGFFGSSFGASVEVAQYQDTTWITNSTGATQGPQVNNIKWTHPSSGSINGAASVNLNQVPNYLATLNIRFSHDTAVRTQNAKVRIFDRSNINNPASGVTTKFAEIIHTETTQTATGSGDTSWLTPTGSSVIVDMVSSPGLSGYSPNGPGTQDKTHDWFTAISASPDSVGSKTLYGLYFQVEYL